MRAMRSAFLLAFAAAANLTLAEERRAADAESFKTAVAASQPGDVIIMAAGAWQDADLLFAARGKPGSPVTLRAAEAGKTVLAGKSRLRIAGEHLVVSGLWFQNPVDEEVIQFRADAKTHASRCRLTECAVTDDGTQPVPGKEGRWLNLYGTENEVDHCYFAGKRTKGTLAVVWLGFEPEGGHRIHHNHFGPRARLGKNGGETIRIGDSKTSLRDARCIVESNVFERCNGESEIISNKSCANLYRENVFLACQGALTLRHGHRCRVERNWFLGMGEKETGGIRVIGEDHVVSQNYLQDLLGDEFRSGITLVAGIPDSPLNGYHPVRRARIEGNILVNCKHPVLIGFNDEPEAIVRPVDCQITANLILCPDAKQAFETAGEMHGFEWKDNLVRAKTPGVTATGIEERAVELRKADDGIFRTPNGRPKGKPIGVGEVGPWWRRGRSA